ncbi:MAG: anti-sigma factor [Actinobacteria bacterium]|nr:anti-sigma factor [Actinomycetota bacterium]
MMDHLHPDQLAALALESDPDDAEVAAHLGDADDAAHLEECARCRRELDILREVMARARRARPDETPPAPPEEIWDRVVRELSSSGDLSASEPPARLPFWRQPWVAAAALVVLVVVAAVGLLRFDGEDSIIAQADLEPLADVDETSAALVVQGDQQALTVDQPALPEIDGYYELWLLSEDGGLVSLGPLTDAGRYRVPAAIDTDVYSIVDISREPPDGDPTHSTDSVLRGPLEPTV